MFVSECKINRFISKFRGLAICKCQFNVVEYAFSNNLRKFIVVIEKNLFLQFTKRLWFLLLNEHL